MLRIGRTSAYDLARRFLATDGATGLPVVRLGRQLRVPRFQLERLAGGPITWPPTIDAAPVDVSPSLAVPAGPMGDASRGSRRCPSPAEANDVFSPSSSSLQGVRDRRVHGSGREYLVTVRVTTLKGPSAGAYYVEQLPAYYLDAGEPRGVWLGQGADMLGLSGEVEDEAFLAVMAGSDPRRPDRDLGRSYDDRSVRGFDVTCSAPKSVSVLWALGDDPVRAHVVAAHDAAVAAVAGWMEAHAHIRYRIGGEVDAEGVIAVAFRQHTSRTVDPQLHTHQNGRSAVDHAVSLRSIDDLAREAQEATDVLSGLTVRVVRRHQATIASAFSCEAESQPGLCRMFGGWIVRG